MQDDYPGPSWQEDTYVVDAVMLEDTGQIALGLADGRIVFRLLDKPEQKLGEIQAHNGLTSLRKGFGDNDLISTGEDGKVLRIKDMQATQLAVFEKAWIEHVALHYDVGLIAVAYKKTAVVMDEDGAEIAHFADHPSAITGIAFDAKGKRLALSHYNGASLWWVNGDAAQKPVVLEWKGSHIGLNWSPNGKYLLSVMQENALHGWRLPDFDDFAMNGYVAKPKSLSWDMKGRWLATSGAPGIICWDYGGKGPMGRPAIQLGEQCPDVSVKVACHPELPVVAAGTVGGLVYAARFEDQHIAWMRTNAKSEITVLNWSESGTYLCAATESGQAYLWRFLD